MTQTIVLKKLAAFAKTRHTAQHSELENRRRSQRLNPKFMERLKPLQATLKKNHDELVTTLDDGHCFSLSLNYGIQHYFGKRVWWKGVLQHVATSDNQPDSLTKTIVIRGGAPTKKRKTSGELIALAMNAVLSIQGHRKYLPTGIGQDNILNPDGCIEYLDKGVIYSIKSHKQIAGTFSKNKLIDILKSDNFQKTIILVHSGFHTIYLGQMTESIWVIYDPNYKHKNIETMDKQGTLKECVDEAIKVQESTALCLEFASFDPDKKFTLPVWSNMIETDFESLVKGDGFLQVCEYHPMELLAWLDEVDQSPETRDRAVKNFKNIFTRKWGNGNGLEEIVGDNEKILLQMLKMGKESFYYESMRLNILKALAEKNENTNVALVAFIRYRPRDLLAILDFVVTDNASLVAVMDLFNAVNDKNISVWSRVDQFDSLLKGKLLNFLVTKMTGVDYNYFAALPSGGINFMVLLLKALLLKLPVKGVDHGFEAVIQKHPEVLPAIVKLGLTTTYGFAWLKLAFSTRRDFSKQGNWEKLSSATEKTRVMELLVEHIGQMDEKTLNEQLKSLPTNGQGSSAEWMLDRRATRSLSLTAFLQKEILVSLQRFTPVSAVSMKIK